MYCPFGIPKRAACLSIAPHFSFFYHCSYFVLKYAQRYPMRNGYETEKSHSEWLENLFSLHSSVGRA